MIDVDIDAIVTSIGGIGIIFAWKDTLSQIISNAIGVNNGITMSVVRSIIMTVIIIIIILIFEYTNKHYIKPNGSKLKTIKKNI